METYGHLLTFTLCIGKFKRYIRIFLNLLETAFLPSSALLGPFEQFKITTSSFSATGVSITVLWLIKTGVAVTSCAATEAYKTGVDNYLAATSAHV